MAGRAVVLFGAAWALGLAAAAPLCLSRGSGLPRDLWAAGAVALLPLLPKLARFAVAAPSHPRKMLSVYGEMARRFALTLGLALALFFWVEAELTAFFWVGLAFAYQAALALETALLLDSWNQSSAPNGPPGGSA